MPALSEAQRRAAAVALAAKLRRRDPDSLYGPARRMYESMNIRELERMASR